MRHWVWTQQLYARGLETRPAERRQGLAGFQGTAPSHRSATSAAGVEGGGGAWPGFETTHQDTHQHASRRRCGGRRRDLPRCRWAAAGPGRASSRRAERSSQRERLAGGSPPTGTHSDQAPLVWRAPEGPEGTGGLRDRPLRAKLACGDLAGGRARRRPEHQRCHTATTPGPTASGRAGRAAAGDLSGEQATTAGFTRPRGGRPRA